VIRRAKITVGLWLGALFFLDKQHIHYMGGTEAFRCIGINGAPIERAGCKAGNGKLFCAFSQVFILLCYNIFFRSREMTSLKNTYFLALEHLPEGARLDAAELLSHLAFNEQGLLPVITQDVASKDVLMMAWANRQALEYTLETGFATYWSRSRQALWKKGESSGHLQHIEEIRIDCDGDTLLFLVSQVGAACHTGRRHCFYFTLMEDNQVCITSDPGQGVNAGGKA